MGLSLESCPLGPWFLRAAAVFAKAFQIYPFGQLQQQVGHLPVAAVAELSLPLLIRDGHLSFSGKRLPKVDVKQVE